MLGPGVGAPAERHTGEEDGGEPEHRLRREFEAPRSNPLCRSPIVAANPMTFLFILHLIPFLGRMTDMFSTGREIDREQLSNAQ
jgi:hypothetical protein